MVLAAARKDKDGIRAWIAQEVVDFNARVDEAESLSNRAGALPQAANEATEENLTAAEKERKGELVVEVQRAAAASAEAARQAEEARASAEEKAREAADEGKSLEELRAIAELVRQGAEIVGQNKQKAGEEAGKAEGAKNKVDTLVAEAAARKDSVRARSAHENSASLVEEANRNTEEARKLAEGAEAKVVEEANKAEDARRLTEEARRLVEENARNAEVQAGIALNELNKANDPRLTNEDLAMAASNAETAALRAAAYANGAEEAATDVSTHAAAAKRALEATQLESVKAGQERARRESAAKAAAAGAGSPNNGTIDRDSIKKFFKDIASTTKAGAGHASLAILNYDEKKDFVDLIRRDALGKKGGARDVVRKFIKEINSTRGGDPALLVPLGCSNEGEFVKFKEMANFLEIFQNTQAFAFTPAIHLQSNKQNPAAELFSIKPGQLSLDEDANMKDRRKYNKAPGEIDDTSNRPNDDRVYYMEFGRCKFSEELGEDKSKANKIFNDCNLFKASFRGCEFENVDFSNIEVSDFESINFNRCVFKGSCILPAGIDIDIIKGDPAKKNNLESYKIGKNPSTSMSGGAAEAASSTTRGSASAGGI